MPFLVLFNQLSFSSNNELHEWPNAVHSLLAFRMSVDSFALECVSWRTRRVCLVAYPWGASVRASLFLSLTPWRKVKVRATASLASCLPVGGGQSARGVDKRDGGVAKRGEEGSARAALLLARGCQSHAERQSRHLPSSHANCQLNIVRVVLPVICLFSFLFSRLNSTPAFYLFPIRVVVFFFDFAPAEHLNKCQCDFSQILPPRIPKLICCFVNPKRRVPCPLYDTCAEWGWVVLSPRGRWRWRWRRAQWRPLPRVAPKPLLSATGWYSLCTREYQHFKGYYSLLLRPLHTHPHLRTPSTSSRNSHPNLPSFNFFQL